MPSFLKSLFKRRSVSVPQTQSRSQRYSTDQHARGTDIATESEDEITQLAAILRVKLGARNQSGLGHHLRSQGQSEETVRRLVELLDQQNIRVDPYPPAVSERKGKGTKYKLVGKAKGDTKKEVSNGLFDEVLQACSSAIRSTEYLASSAGLRSGSSNENTINHLLVLLEAQHAELVDMEPYVADRRFPALITLKQVYDHLSAGLEDVSTMPKVSRGETLSTLLKVVQEGPDYIMDIILLSALVFQGEIIDPSFGSEIRQILESAINVQSDLVTFRRATESVIALSSAVPREWLDDRQSEEAYKDMGVLIKLLQVRVAKSALPSRTTSPIIKIVEESKSSKVKKSALKKAPASSAPSTPTSITPTSSTTSPEAKVDSTYHMFDASALQARFGTGPGVSQLDSGPSALPGLSSYRATVAPNLPDKGKNPSPPSPTGSGSEESIWEYRGQRLTRSALDLVLREEALAQADSSGQYAGEVSWDDLRNAWIPKWVQKLSVKDITDDGELPDTTPAGFKVKEKDAWGNKIGWYGPHKEMFYVEEPKFELRD